MASSDSVYSIFQTLDNEELIGIFGSLDKDFKLLVPKKLTKFVHKGLIQVLEQTKKSIAYLEGLKKTDKALTLLVIAFEEPSLISYILEHLKQAPNAKVHLLIMPGITHSSQYIISNHVIANQITTHEFKLDIFPYDSRSFVVPVSKCYSACFVQNDITPIYTIARALLKLQLITGLPHRIGAAGEISNKILVLMEELRQQVGYSNFKDDSQFEQIIIIDRKTDLVTPFLRQSTYEGMIDEKYEVEFDILTLPEGIKFDEKSDTVLIGESDPVYSELGNLPISTAFEKFEELGVETKTIGELMMSTRGTNKWKFHAERAEKLKQMLPYLNMHGDLINDLLTLDSFAQEMINFETNILYGMDYDQNLIIRLMNREHWMDALRLLSLASVTNRGIKKSFLDDVKKRLVGKFGFHFANDLIRLNNGGIIKEQKNAMFKKNSVPSFTKIVETFDLINSAEVELRSYYSNFVPSLIRIAQKGITGEWEAQTTQTNLLEAMKVPTAYKNLREPSYRTKPRVLVFVVGGVTATERLIIKDLGRTAFNDQIEVHCGSTSIINSKKLLQEVCPHLQ